MLLNLQYDVLVATPWVLLPVGILLLILSWSIGAIAAALLNEQAFDRHIAAGAVVITALIAVVFTSFKTVFLPVALVFFALIWFRRKTFTQSLFFLKQHHIGEWVVLSVYFLIFFLLQAVVNYQGSGQWAVNYIDNYAYIAQINWMYTDGIETRYLELEKNRYGFEAFLKPYHYFENWPAVLAKALTNQLGYFVFNLLLIPFLAAILMYQNRQIILLHFKTQSMYAFLVPLVVFTTLRFTLIDEWLFDALRSLGVHTDYSKFIFFQNLGWWHFFSYLYGLKLLVSGIFITPIVYYFLQHNLKSIGVYAAVLPLASLIYVPLALVATFGTALRNTKGLKSIYTYLPLIAVAWVWLFYKAFDKDDVVPFATNLAGAFMARVNFLFTEPHVFAFQSITEFFGNYYWLLLPLLIFLVLSKKINIRIRALGAWVAVYPLTGLSFDLLFKLFVAGWLALTMVNLWHFRRQLIRYQIHAFIVFYAGFKVFNTLLGDVYDFHQIYALTVPVAVYALIVMCWGYILKDDAFNKWVVFGVFLFVIGTNMLAIRAENVRSFKPGEADQAFYRHVFERMAPEKKIKSVYYSKFTLMPYIHYDRVGDELLHYTDDFTTTLFAIDLFTRSDTLAAEKMGARGFFDALPLVKYLKKSGYTKGDITPYKLQFLKDNNVEFVLRRTDYPREKLNYLNPYLVDSAFNHQLDYQIFRLKFE